MTYLRIHESILFLLLLDNFYLKLLLNNLENVQYLLNIACLIFLKLKIGYIVLPLAVYYFYKKYDSRIFIETSIVLLMTSAYLLNLSEDAANDVAIIAYYFLVLGVLGALIEYIRESKTEDYSEKDRINSKGI